MMPSASWSAAGATPRSAGRTCSWSCGISRWSSAVSPATSSPRSKAWRTGLTSPPISTQYLPGEIVQASISSTSAVLTMASAARVPWAMLLVSSAAIATTITRS